MYISINLMNVSLFLSDKELDSILKKYHYTCSNQTCHICMWFEYAGWLGTFEFLKVLDGVETCKLYFYSPLDHFVEILDDTGIKKFVEFYESPQEVVRLLPEYSNCVELIFKTEENLIAFKLKYQ